MYNPQDIAKSIENSLKKYNPNSDYNFNNDYGVSNSFDTPNQQTKNNTWDEYYSNLYKGKTSDVEEHRSIMNRIGDVLSVGQYTAMGVLNGIVNNIKGNGDFGVAEGFMGGLRAANPFGKGYVKGEHSFSHVISDLGWKPTSTAGRIAKMTLGLAGDIFLDPTTYASGGLSALFRGTGKAGLELFKSTEVASKLAEFEKAGYKVTDKYMEELPQQAYNMAKDRLSKTNELLSADEIEHMANKEMQSMAGTLSDMHTFTMDNAMKYARNIADDLISKGHTVTDEQVVADAEQYFRKYNELAGVKADKGITFSLGNAPFGKKIFRGLADKKFTISTPEAYQKLGDATLAPAMAKVRDAFYGSKVGSMLSTNSVLYKVGKENPEELFRTVKFMDVIKSQNLDRVSEELKIRELGQQLNFSPSQQKELLSLLEDKKLWGKISAIAKFSKTQEAQQIRRDMEDTKNVAQQELDDLLKQHNELRNQSKAAEQNVGMFKEEISKKKQRLSELNDLIGNQVNNETEVAKLTAERDALQSNVDELSAKFKDSGYEELLGKTQSAEQELFNRLEQLQNDKNLSVSDLDARRKQLMELVGKTTETKEPFTFENIPMAQNEVALKILENSNQLNNLSGAELSTARETLIGDLNKFLFNGKDVISSESLDFGISKTIDKIRKAYYNKSFMSAEESKKFFDDVRSEVLSSPHLFSKEGKDILNFVRQNITNKGQNRYGRGSAFKGFGDYYTQRKSTINELFYNGKTIKGGFEIPPFYGKEGYLETKAKEFGGMSDEQIFNMYIGEFYKKRASELKKLFGGNLSLKKVIEVNDELSSYIRSEHDWISYFYAKPEAMKNYNQKIQMAQEAIDRENTKNLFGIDDTVDRSGWIDDLQSENNLNKENKANPNLNTTELKNKINYLKNNLLNDIRDGKEIKYDEFKSISGKSYDEINSFIQNNVDNLENEINKISGNRFRASTNDEMAYRLLNRFQQVWQDDRFANETADAIQGNLSDTSKNFNKEISYLENGKFNDPKSDSELLDKYSYLSKILDKDKQVEEVNKLLSELKQNKNSELSAIQDQYSQLEPTDIVGRLNAVKKQNNYKFLQVKLSHNILLDTLQRDYRGRDLNELTPSQQEWLIGDSVVKAKKLTSAITVNPELTGKEQAMQRYDKLKMLLDENGAKNETLLDYVQKKYQNIENDSSEISRLADYNGKRNYLILGLKKDLQTIGTEPALIEGFKKKNPDLAFLIGKPENEISNYINKAVKNIDGKIQKLKDSRNARIAAEKEAMQTAIPAQIQVNKDDFVQFFEKNTDNLKLGSAPESLKINGGKVLNSFDDENGVLHYVVSNGDTGEVTVRYDQVINTFKEQDRATNNFVKSQQGFVTNKVTTTLEDVQPQLDEIDGQINQINKEFDKRKKQIEYNFNRRKNNNPRMLREQLTKLEEERGLQIDELKQSKQKIADLNQQIRVANQANNSASKLLNSRQTGDAIKRTTQAIQESQRAFENQISYLDNTNTSLFESQKRIDELTQKITDYNNLLNNDDAFENYVRFQNGEDFVRRAKDNMLSQSTVYEELLNNETTLDEKTKNIIGILKANLYDIGLSEVEIGKLTRGQFDKMFETYIPHMATQEFVDLKRAMEANPEKGVQNVQFDNIGFGSKGFNANNIQRQIKSIELNGETIDDPSIVQINELFKEQLKGKNAFSENIADLYIKRAMNNLDLLYDDKYMRTMMDVFGNDVFTHQEGKGATFALNHLKEHAQKFEDFYNNSKNYLDMLWENTTKKNYEQTVEEQKRVQQDILDFAMEIHGVAKDSLDNMFTADSKNGFQYSVNAGMLREMLKTHTGLKTSADMTKAAIKEIQVAKSLASTVVKSMSNSNFYSALMYTAQNVADNVPFEDAFRSATGFMPPNEAIRMKKEIQSYINHYSPQTILSYYDTPPFEFADVLREKHMADFRKSFTPEIKKEMATKYADAALEKLGYTAESLSENITPIFNLTKEQVDAFKEIMSDTIAPNFDESFKMFDTRTNSDRFYVSTFLNHIKKVAESVDNLDFSKHVKSVNDAITMKANQARIAQIMKDKSRFLMAYDKVTSLMKLNMTVVNPAFHMRNLYSNYFQIYLSLGASALNPKFQAQVIKAIMSKGRLGSDAVIEALGKDGVAREVHWGDILAHAKAHGVLGKDYFTSEASQLMDSNAGLFSNNRFFGGKFAKIDPTNTTNFAPYKYGAKLGSAFEDYSRLLHFAAAVKQGQTWSEAADTVNKFMLDYSDLTPFEQNTLRRVIPFYTWMKKNTALQIDTLLNNPGRYQMYFKGINAIEGTNDDDNARVNKGLLPSYLRDYVQTPFRVKKGYSGNFNTVFWNTAMPVNDLNRLDIFDPKGVAQDLFGSLSPIVKAPIEQAMNYNTFFEQPIVKDGENAVSARGQHLLSQIATTNLVKGFANKEGTDLGYNVLDKLTGIKFAQVNQDFYKKQAGLIEPGQRGRKSKQQQLMEYYDKLYNGGEVNQ